MHNVSANALFNIFGVSGKTEIGSDGSSSTKSSVPQPFPLELLLPLRILLLISAIVANLCIASAVTEAQEPLEYVPAAVDNPLKGLVPYSGDKRQNFPHSMEFNYLALSDLMIGMKDFNWEPVEQLLNDVASRGHQTTFRVWMVYPGFDKGIPEFLVKDGLKVTTWLDKNTEPFPPGKVHTPDYDDPRLRKALLNFIEALGEKYDGDPRIGFLTAGLLGVWGEWHEYPRQDLFASKDTQAAVLSAFTAAFKTTPVLLRYPTNDQHWLYTSNHDRPFGYHDDSFAWATLDTGRDEDNWFFMPSLKVAGQPALDKWKQHPIGGEIRPELWGLIFDKKTDHPKAQDFDECVRATHATWLMDTGMSEEKQSAERIANASRAVQKMGYEFHISQAAVERNAERMTARIELHNTGVAPFYYDWKVELAALNDAGKPIKRWPTDWKITALLPESGDRSWKHTIDVATLPQDGQWLAVRVVNPLPSGLPLRFANAADRQQPDGWFRIGKLLETTDSAK